MSAIVIPSALREQLLAVHGTVELRDEQGLLVGEFVRKLDLSEYEVIGTPFTREEVEEHLRSSRRFTPEQVMERLRSIK